MAHFMSTFRVRVLLLLMLSVMMFLVYRCWPEKQSRHPEYVVRALQRVSTFTNCAIQHPPIDFQTTTGGGTAVAAAPRGKQHARRYYRILRDTVSGLEEFHCQATAANGSEGREICRFRTGAVRQSEGRVIKYTTIYYCKKVSLGIITYVTCDFAHRRSPIRTARCGSSASTANTNATATSIMRASSKRWTNRRCCWTASSA